MTEGRRPRFWLGSWGEGQMVTTSRWVPVRVDVDVHGDSADVSRCGVLGRGSRAGVVTVLAPARCDGRASPVRCSGGCPGEDAL
jgi:hypothetical protein